MKVELRSGMYEATGLMLRLIPETDVEEALLMGMWQFGTLEIADHGFEVHAFRSQVSDEKQKAA